MKAKIISLITAILMSMIVVFGQNSNPEMKTVNKHSRPDPNPVLVGRFEKIIKNKEKKFVGKREVVNKDDDGAFGMLVWKLHEDYVGVRVSDFYSLQDALKQMSSMTDTGKRGMRVILTKLTNLGDEAYIVIHNYPPHPPNTEMGVRKGNVVLRISSTNPILAKRFAKYFVREIEKRDKGEP
ncbi:MAG TPA: hypothetical protein PKY82_23010 [Pyrinomonadaceae bacterium]|nr:hypothetical protein [Pyrinomonadaceae bacterium]